MVAAKKASPRKAVAKRMAQRKPKGSMSDAHKRALATGREESRAVAAYLEALDAAQPKRRGRRRSQETIHKRIAAIDTTLPQARALQRLLLTQERSDLQAELSATEAGVAVDLDGLRAGFIRVAMSYGERKGIRYATWRAVGVDAATLREAGIGRAR